MPSPALSRLEISTELDRMFNMPSKTFIEHNRTVIFAREKLICNLVSASVIEKPKLGVWMILIPIFFVFYFWQLSRYSQGRKDFADNFLLSREQALNCAYKAAIENTEPDVDDLLKAIDLPEQATKKYCEWITFLAAHYLQLLKARGDSYTDLVRASYEHKKALMNFYQNLNIAEKNFIASVTATLNVEKTEGKEIVSRIEEALARERKKEINEIFP